MNIGIVGVGYVGKALKAGFEDCFDIITYDKNPELSSSNSIQELARKCQFIFVCVPTPMMKDGSCDISIVQEVVGEINDLKYEDRIVVIKSTVLPGTSDNLSAKFTNINIVFNPEFLTEANYIEDFKNQNRVILGGDLKSSGIVKDLYKKVFPRAKIIETSYANAEMVKYFCNTFLATKVSFANEMKMLCDSLGVDYNEVLESALYDERIGNSHLNVPGPDGELGFGGSCFPKDINAILHLANKLGLDLYTLNGVWDTNLKVRPSKDWVKLKGRSTNSE